MDSSQWTQEYGVAAKGGMGGHVGESAACTLINRPAAAAASSVSMERKVMNNRPQKEQVINCPRCQSTNTKFCYYNNYSLTQPRYFCKTCRRYWTEGGTLRNVPVGGGSRKNKTSTRSSSSSSSNSSSSNKLLINNLPDLNPPTTTISPFSTSSHDQNPKLLVHHTSNDQGHDLNLGFQLPPHQDYHHHHHHGNNNIPQFLEFPSKIIQNGDHLNSNPNNNNSSASSTTSPLSALNFLRSSGIGSYNPPTFIPMAPSSGNVDDHQANNVLFASAFQFQEIKPSSLAFTFDADRYGNPTNHEQPDQNSINGALMFTLGSSAPKQQHSTTTASTHQHDLQADDHKGHGGNGINGYWNGMLGGGGSW